MTVTVEMSLYPLEAEYKSIILDFIVSLRGHEGITTYTTEMSTYIKGEWVTVMGILTTELDVVYQRVPASATVLKIIPQDLPIEDGYRTI